MTAPPTARRGGEARPREISLDGAGGRRVSVDRRSDFDDDRIFPGRFVSPRAMRYWYSQCEYRVPLPCPTTLTAPVVLVRPRPGAPSPSASSPPRVSPRGHHPRRLADANPVRARAAARVPTPRSRRPETPRRVPPDRSRGAPNVAADERECPASKSASIQTLWCPTCPPNPTPFGNRSEANPEAHHAKFSFLPEAGCAPTSAGGSPSTLRSGSARPRAKTKERASPKNSGLEVRDSEETPPSTSPARVRTATSAGPWSTTRDRNVWKLRPSTSESKSRLHAPRHSEGMPPERNQATNGVTRRRGESRVRSRGTPAASARTGARDPPERGLDKRAECVPRRGAPTRDVSGKIVAVDERARERRQRDPRERIRRDRGFADGEDGEVAERALGADDGEDVARQPGARLGGLTPRGERHEVPSS